MRSVGIVAAMFALSGCTTQDGLTPAMDKTSQRAETPPHPAPPAPTGSPFLATHSRSVVPQAISTGVFSVSSGCVVYTLAGTSSSFLAVLPSSARFTGEADAPVGLSFDGRDVQFGEEVETTGGEVPASALSFYGVMSPVPESCPKSIYIIGGISNGHP